MVIVEAYHLKIVLQTFMPFDLILGVHPAVGSTPAKLENGVTQVW